MRRNRNNPHLAPLAVLVMRCDNSLNCCAVIVGQPHEAQMCNESENLQQAVIQITTLHYIQLTVFSRKTWVCQHQKGKPLWILMKQETMGWQWLQLDHMQIIFISLQTYNHASTSPLSFLQAGCSSCRPSNSVRALKAVSQTNY